MWHSVAGEGRGCDRFDYDFAEKENLEKLPTETTGGELPQLPQPLLSAGLESREARATRRKRRKLV